MRKITSMMSEWKAQRAESEGFLHYDDCKGGYFSILPEYGLQVNGGDADGQCVKAGSKIRCCGKNLFNKNTVTLNVDISIGSGGTYQNADRFTSDFIPVLPNTTYIITWQTVKYGCFYDSKRTFLGSGNYFTTSKFTTPEKCHYIMFGGTKAEIEYIQLEFGNTATAFAPYIGNEITVPCDLHEGDRWYPMTGKVTRNGGGNEQYDPQPIFAPQGVVNVLQSPEEIPARLSATMMVRR